MENKNINKNCGEKPSYEEFIEVGNDPNFVFKNDENYNTLILYDQEGNIVDRRAGRHIEREDAKQISKEIEEK